MSPVFRVAAIVVAWVFWMTPFAIRRARGTQTAVKVDPRARWGILLSAAGFMLAFTHRPAVWASPISVWRLAGGVALAALSIAVVWRAVGNLGKQWRMDAGLNADHELVTSGPYRVVRHPIYASMFGMLLAALSFVGTLPGAILAVIFLAIGIEVRVHIEDRLLRERFGERFNTWQRAVAAWIPFIR